MAKKHIENLNYKSAFFICTTIMEEIVDVIKYNDDSNGNFGGSIDLAYEMINGIIKAEPSEDIRDLIFEYCVTAFDNHLYSGWDWHIGMLYSASLLIKTEEEAKIIFELIDRNRLSEYEIQSAQSIKYDILVKTQSEQEADSYL